MHPIANAENAGVLYKLLISPHTSGNTNQLAISILLFAYTCGLGIYFVFLINAHEILHRKTWIPLFFFVAIHFIFNQFQAITPAAILEGVILLATGRFLKLDAEHRRVTGFLDMGLYSGLGVLIDINIVFFITI